MGSQIVGGLLGGIQSFSFLIDFTGIVYLFVRGRDLGSLLNDICFKIDIWTLNDLLSRTYRVNGLSSFISFLEATHVLVYNGFDFLLVFGIVVGLDENLIEDLAKIGAKLLMV